MPIDNLYPKKLYMTYELCLFRSDREDILIPLILLGDRFSRLMKYTLCIILCLENNRKNLRSGILPSNKHRNHKKSMKSVLKRVSVLQ